MPASYAASHLPAVARGVRTPLRASAVVSAGAWRASVRCCLHSCSGYPPALSAVPAARVRLPLLPQLLAVQRTGAEDRDTVREIKEKLTYVALDFDAEIKKINESVTSVKSFKLPDGRLLKIDNQRLLVRTPELLFNPAAMSGREDTHAYTPPRPSLIR